MEINGYKIMEINVSEYSNNGNTAIELICLDGSYPSPFAIITVNFDEVLANNQAYLDTNNCKWVEDFMKTYNFGKPLGKYMQSGFCTYPLYELNIQNLKDYNKTLTQE